MITPLVTPDPTIEHEIRLRAYELYLLRGRENGHDRDDWLQAERDILRELDDLASEVEIFDGSP